MLALIDDLLRRVQPRQRPMHRSRRIGYLCVCAGLWVCAIGPCANLAQAGEVAAPATYSGCAGPRPTSNGHTFYIDPGRGSLRGDGSKMRPWRTLAEVFSQNLFANAPTHWDNQHRIMVRNNPLAPIKSGDTLVLMSGDHGRVLIQGQFGGPITGYDNADFITVEAAPGANPIVQQLQILGAGKWIFRHLTFEHANTTGKYVTAGNGNTAKDIWLAMVLGGSHDIVIQQNIFRSKGNTAQWAPEDWRAKRVSGALDYGNRCIALLSNKFENIGFAIQTQKSEKVLIENNTINNFTDDGIDYGSDDLLIKSNVITNSIEDRDGFHRDGLQGQPANPKIPVTNVVIDSNQIIRIAAAGLKYPALLQGIDAFDGIWDNITVKNNTVITHAYQGISFYGVHHALLQHNVLLDDSGKLLNCVNSSPICNASDVIYDHKMVPNINVIRSKDGLPSRDVVIRDNIATGYNADFATQNFTFVDNVCLLGSTGKCTMALPPTPGRDGTWVALPGTYRGRNTISRFAAAEYFKKFNTLDAVYDLSIVKTEKSPK